MDTLKSHETYCTTTVLHYLQVLDSIGVSAKTTQISNFNACQFLKIIHIVSTTTIFFALVKGRAYKHCLKNRTLFLLYLYSFHRHHVFNTNNPYISGDAMLNLYFNSAFASMSPLLVLETHINVVHISLGISCTCSRHSCTTLGMAYVLPRKQMIALMSAITSICLSSFHKTFGFSS